MAALDLSSIITSAVTNMVASMTGLHVALAVFAGLVAVGRFVTKETRAAGGTKGRASATRETAPNRAVRMVATKDSTVLQHFQERRALGRGVDKNYTKAQNREYRDWLSWSGADDRTDAARRAGRRRRR